MSYAYSGKLAGLGSFRPGYGFRGLGTAASDAAYGAAVLAYNQDHALWLQQKAAYDKALAAFQGESAGAAQAYSQATMYYNMDLTAWNKESAAHAQALVQAQQQALVNQKMKDAGNAAARAKGVVLPATYGGCVTQGQHNAWQADCNTVNAPVKGLGQDPTGPSCALALLPVCPPAIPLVPALRPKPTPPPPQLVFQPPAPLRPEPKPPLAPPPTPVVVAMPSPSPLPPPASISPVPNQPTSIGPAPQASPVPTPTTISPTTKSAGLLSNGLLLVVIAGGSYALYRTFKKPKAKA